MIIILVDLAIKALTYGSSQQIDFKEMPPKA